MKNILIIRRDNIGDLVCTTPLIAGIKQTYPDAKIYLLINKVSQDVVKNNPYIEKTFVYKKAKHRAADESTLTVYLQRLQIMYQLRQIDFDAAILANPEPCQYSLRLARMAGVKHIIGADLGNKQITRPLARGDFVGHHQVEKTFSYLRAISNDVVAIPPLNVYLSDDERQQAALWREARLPDAKRIYAVHISSRIENRRWPVERYAEIINRLVQQTDVSVLIFWSPQGTLERDDIGDQQRAEQLMGLCPSARVALYPTASVRELLAGFNLCDVVLCSDGGQMHLAAALHKKLVVFFGDTDQRAWHPWSGQYHILQTESGECKDVTVEDVWQPLHAMAQ